MSQVLSLRINTCANDSGNNIPPRDFGQEFGSPYHAFDVAVAGRDRDLRGEIHLCLIGIPSAVADEVNLVKVHEFIDGYPALIGGILQQIAQFCAKSSSPTCEDASS